MLIHFVQSSPSGLPGGLVCLFYTGFLEYADMFDNQGVLVGGVLILGKGSKLCLKAGFPPLLGVKQFENRLPSALPGIQGEGEIQGCHIKGALLFSWLEGEFIAQVVRSENAALFRGEEKREEQVARCLAPGHTVAKLGDLRPICSQSDTLHLNKWEFEEYETTLKYL